MVKQFHDTFGVNLSRRRETSCRFMRSEIRELEAAIAAGDVVGILDAFTDLQYFLDGSYLAFGLDGFKQAAFEEVHRSNMSKGPGRRKDGKIMKGPNYSPPDLKAVLDKGIRL